MIRPVVPDDAPDITRLWNHMIRETLSTFTTQEKSVEEITDMCHARQDAFFVAETDRSFAGFATFAPFRSGPGYAATAEHTILVTPEAEGAGTAARLLASAETAAGRQGIHVMVAGISGTNLRAIAFHAREGYAEVARMPEVGRKNGEWLDLVLMQKILSASR
ncbi:GNAT family N-acetyltransferase [Roseobacter sp. S98]|uniref:GNAT family N-acetyltransferase n=1 Tax=Roseobacter algicola (ex Choi et al. 2025) (nom. illeg.) TaxID=3092138 RepID=UPI0035C78A80